MPPDKPRSQTSSDPYVFKRGNQEAQVILQKYLIFFILRIILSSSSRQGSTRMRRRGSLRISHIRLHRVYYDTCALFSSTKLRIYDKVKCDQVKVIIFNKSAMESNIFLFDTIKPKIGHSQVRNACVYVHIK